LSRESRFAELIGERLEETHVAEGADHVACVVLVGAGDPTVLVKLRQRWLRPSNLDTVSGPALVPGAGHAHKEMRFVSLFPNPISFRGMRRVDGFAMLE